MFLRIGIIVAGFLASTAWAQSSLVGGALEGAVSDSTGGRIPEATVTAREVSTHQSREVSTNGEGIFRIQEMAPGTYEVLVSQSGFATYRHAGVTIPLGATVHLDVAMQSAGVSTQVTVTAQPSPIDPAQISVSSAVDKERIEELPVESRNYLNFTLLASGVASSAQQAGRSLAPLSDSGFTFGGLRGRSNNITIDGLDNNDEYVGASRTELSLETVQEFQVVNSGLSAETGGASGGSINVITRIGANTIHGDAFVFVENGSLNARNPFETENVRPKLHRYRTGVALGGPLRKDRTFYYAAFEQEYNRGLEDSFISQPLAGAVNQILAGGVFPRIAAFRINDGLFPVSRAETEASVKVNHQLTAANSLMLRYAFTNNREAGDAFNTAGWTDPSGRGSSFIRDQAVVGSLTTIFNPHSVGDFRFQIADRRAVLRTNDTAVSGIGIAGLVNFGRPYDGNGRRTETHEQVTYTYSHAGGSGHLWKAGATINRVNLDAAMADGFGGMYLFADLAHFAAGRPNMFRQTFGAINTAYAVQNFGAFIQDHWSVARGLTLDIGLRYDFEHLPSMLRQDGDNLSPRVGLAYQVAPGWVLRSGYGLFFDRYVLASLNPVLQTNGLSAFDQVVEGKAATAVFQSAGGGPLAAPYVGAMPSVYRADPSLATPYSQQVSFAVEHLLARDLTVNASYLFVRGVKLSRTRNVNLLPPGPFFGTGRAYSQFNDIYQLEDSASSNYQGASVILNRRMSNELEFSASYTFSKALDNASDFDEQPENPFALVAERALSRQDQRHRLVFNALWELPIGDEEAGKPPTNNLFTKVFSHIEIAPIFTLESGRPVNPLTGIDSNGNDAFPLSSRPLGFGRNTFKTPMLANLDFRILKYFPFGETAKLDVVAEAFNLLNRANVAQINPVFGPGPAALPGFLQPLTALGARRIQFSLDFEF